ncbi:MAG: hypothetical protein KDA81_09905, partial [Planctomycetaceae bacterium]|nr:hypothetical protein [Planctomycetaceae bacterium]
MSEITNNHVLPSAIEAKLRSIRWRQIMLALVRAVVASATVLCAAMLVAMIIDWWFVLFSTTIRTILTTVSLTAAGVTLLVVGRSPLLKALRIRAVAEAADRTVPQLEERWLTVASFANTADRQLPAVTAAMLRQVTHEASAMERLVKPAQVASPASVRRPLLSFAAVSLVLIAFLMLNWPITSVLLRRFWSPAVDITATQLTGDAARVVVPRGTVMDLVIRQSGVQRRLASLELLLDESDPETMTVRAEPDADNAFVHRIAATTGFRYRASAGDDRTDWFQVEVIDYPEFSDVELVVTPPKYVDRPAYRKNLIPNRVRAVQGSQLTLAVRPANPVGSLELELELPDQNRVVSEDNTSADENGKVREALTLQADSDGWYRFDAELLRDLAFRPLMVSREGLENEDRHWCRIEVITDKAPVARIISPTNEMAVANDDLIDIQFDAHDDFGITAAELVVYQDPPEGSDEEPQVLWTQPIELPANDGDPQRHVSGSVQLDLKKLNLKEGTSISYAVRVTDNRNVDLTKGVLTARQDSELKSEGKTDSATEPNNATPAAREASPSASSLPLANTSDRQSENVAQRESGQTNRKSGDDSPMISDGNKKGETLVAANDQSGRPLESELSHSGRGKSNPVTSASEAEQSRSGDHKSDETSHVAEKQPSSGGQSERSGDQSFSRDSDNQPQGNEEKVASSGKPDSDPANQKAAGLNGQPEPGNSLQHGEAAENSEKAGKNRPEASNTSAKSSGKAAANTTNDSDQDRIAPTESDQSIGRVARSNRDADAVRQSQQLASEMLSADQQQSSRDSDQSDDRTSRRSGTAATNPDQPSSDQNPATSESQKSDPRVASDDSTKDDSPAMTSSPDETRDENSDKEAGAQDPRQDTVVKNTVPKNTPPNSEQNSASNGPSQAMPRNQNTTPTAPSPITVELDGTAKPPNDSQRNSGNAPETDTTTDEPEPRRDVDPESRVVRMNPQQSESRQGTETNRRRLKITERLAAVAKALEKEKNVQTRDRVVKIDELLAQAEQHLVRLVERNVPDADRSDVFRSLDEQLGTVETVIADLRTETKEGAMAFVGLQMVDIGRAHVTPARDFVFVGIREPLGSGSHATGALQHVVRARELLAALLKRYDRVAQEQKLADALDESVPIYEVYVEKMQRLMREARQQRNPLQRKTGVVEVDQEYLDRYAEVLTLRREMMRELGRILSDDPRLLARYMDLIKRRRSSLRDQLSELAERQDEISTELDGWLQVDASQRDNLWLLIAELRLQTTMDLARDISELAERIRRQLPLNLEADTGSAGDLVRQAEQLDCTAREMALQIRSELRRGELTGGGLNLVTHADRLQHEFRELDAALDQLSFDHEGDEEITTFSQNRLQESRIMADQADAWRQIAKAIEQQTYHQISGIDQFRLNLATDALRTEINNMETGLRGEFLQVAESEIPGPILDLVRQLQQVMETITLLQSAASFAATQDQLPLTQQRQQQILENFELAEDLFDRIRRSVIEELDQYDVRNPNIADLTDPTLDEFLARLEREPDLQAQLGIPNRPTNLRVLADTMSWQVSGGQMLGDSVSAARQRARKAQMMNEGGRKAKEQDKERLSKEEQAEREQQQKIQQELEKALAGVQEKMKASETSPQQRRQLEQLAETMQQLLKNRDGNNARRQWQQIVETDAAKAVLDAIGRGESIPDDQWNKLMSTLDEGVWQVRGRRPPEEFQRAIEQYQDQIRQLTDLL